MNQLQARLNSTARGTQQSTIPAVFPLTSSPRRVHCKLGMFHVEFYQNGDTLNVREGQTISWTMQVNEQLQDMALAASGLGNLNIYSLDHNSGLWVEDAVERSFSAENGVVTAESTHFSHKNVDQPPPFAANSCLDIEVVDEKGNRLNQADVSIAGRGSARLGCNDIPCVLGDANGEPVFDEDGRIMGVIPWLVTWATTRVLGFMLSTAVGSLDKPRRTHFATIAT